MFQINYVWILVSEWKFKKEKNVSVHSSAVNQVSVKENRDRKKIFFLSFQANRKPQIIVTFKILWNSQIIFFKSFRIYQLKDFGRKLMQELITQLRTLWYNLIMLKYSIWDMSSIDIAYHTSLARWTHLD